jgi:flagellar motility protein MotE (MotC chaperone)
MKKLLPYLRLALFCIALFGISGLAMLLKQGRLLQQKAAGSGEGGDGAAQPDGGSGEMRAGMPGMPSARSGAPGEAPASGPEAARRQQAVAAGRSLFQVPEPISIAEATELLNDLRRQKQEYEARKAALDQRERELEIMEREIETRRSEVLARAEKLRAEAPIGTGEEGADQLDPETVAKVAKLLEGMQPDVGARALKSYTPERAAQILLAMKEQKAAALLGQVPDDVLQRITDALLRARGPAAGE